MIARPHWPDLIDRGVVLPGVKNFRPGRERQLAAQRTGILLDDGEQQQRVAIVWHSPLPWIGKPAFVCPVCNHDCYCLHEKAGVFACRKCHGMSHAQFVPHGSWRASRCALVAEDQC
jgi:hypothetical protein